MALFQKSVLQKHLKSQDQKKIAEAYEQLKKYQAKAVKISEYKEEEYQDGFLRDVFVNVLAYTYKYDGHDTYNLMREKKNVSDIKKADGAILKNQEVFCVIELKDTNTKYLAKVETQAFGYQSGHVDCNYVIISNFEKLNFYIKNKLDKAEFNLFTCTFEQFQELWLCLHAENLLADIPIEVKEESILAEENVTKQLYKDYSAFKTEVWQNIVKNSPEQDQLLLFKKSQKLLDRFLFIFFAEDSGLLPPNSISRMVERFELLKEEDAYKPLYEIFKQYFGYINTGRKGKSAQDDIFEYNGGLFIEDKILDNIKIDDDILKSHVLKMTAYDFQSDINVNILGHIFENSLNEIENISAMLAGEEIDKSKTKRKKNGVFYTPKYITKYIVDNTIGKLCEEKKAKFNIIDEEYAKGRKHRNKEIVKQLDKNLKAYRSWLLEITICDPACGSGAFLNQALEFLIIEHAYIDELSSQLFSRKHTGVTEKAFGLLDVANHILEKNLFGVDINEESVDIAKLSLWLRTAQKGRKLTTLTNNLKCGNSLIDDPVIAGNKAFNWQKEFPQVFQEKENKAWHITTATHDSRTSQRMIDYKVREKRDNGLRPKAQPIWLEKEDEILISRVIAEIIEEDQLNVLAYNICGDHVHLLLVCEEEEMSSIVGKIKAVTANKYNIAKGITTATRGHVPLPENTITMGHVPLPEKENNNNNGTCPIAIEEKEKKKYNSLWTQKFGCKGIDSENQLHNTIEYIQNNRVKHELPPLYNNKGTTTTTRGHVPLSKEEKAFPLVDIDHAFRTQYKGGFDVVIGNPPYVRQEMFKEIKPYLEQNYKCYNSIADLYTYFIERGLFINKNKGLFSFILPNKFLKATYGKDIRATIKKNTGIISIYDFDDYPVFEDATTYSLIFIFKKNTYFNNFTFSKIDKRILDFPLEKLKTEEIKVSVNSLHDNGEWNFTNTDLHKLFEKIKSNSITLSEYVNKEIYLGIKTGKNEAFIISDLKRDELIKQDSKSEEIIKPVATGREARRYGFEDGGKYLLFTQFDIDVPTKYPKIYEWLKTFEKDLIKRGDKGENWWNLRPCDYYDKIQNPKIIWRSITNQCGFYLDATGNLLLSNNNYFISSDSYSLLGILNSKLTYTFLKNICTTLQGGFYDFRRDKVLTVPIPKSIVNDIVIRNKTKLIQKLHLELYNSISLFQNLILTKYNITKPSTKLQNWHTLEFGEFIKELEKARKKAATAVTRGHVPLPENTSTRGHVPLSLSEEAEWMQYFNEQKQKAQELKAQIDKTDKAIDQMVYKLYGLTEDEIKIVEQS